MSKRKSDDFKSPDSIKKGKRSTWTGGVEMQAGEDKESQLEVEPEETEHSKYALSSDDEDDITKLDPLNVKKSQKELQKRQEAKKKVQFNATADKTKKKGEEQALYDPDNILEKDHKFIDNQEFMPFNLDEEREEGKFTDDGRYEFAIDKEERKGADNWLSSTDWKKIDSLGSDKRKEFRAKFDADQEILNNDGAITYSKTDVIECVNEVIDLLLPHENVAKALKRLRPKKKLKARETKQSDRARKSKYSFGVSKVDENGENFKNDEKSGVQADKSEKSSAEMNTSSESTEISPEITKQFLDQKKLKQISDLANKIAGSGYYEVYSDSITQLQTYVDKLKTEIGENTKAAKDDDMDDMFDDSDDENNKNEAGATQWEYRWGNGEGELFGPFSNNDMIEWKEAGFFSDTPEPAMCRRVNTQNFYDAKRCDFDLYA